MKNKLVDLNNHLFAQLERLSDEDTIGCKLTEEIHRSKAITSIGNTIVANARLALDAQLALDDGLTRKIPKMLGIGDASEAI